MIKIKPINFQKENKKFVLFSIVRMNVVRFRNKVATFCFFFRYPVFDRSQYYSVLCKLISFQDQNIYNTLKQITKTMESIKRKYKKRDLIKEAKIQTDLLIQQKAREDFLLKFSNSEAPINIENEVFITNQTEEPCKNSLKSNKTVVERQIPHEHINLRAKQILEKWMYDHRFYCYPNKAEKLLLAKQTQLTLQKVSNWFINSRRRMLPKLLEIEGKRPLDFMINRKAKQADKPPKPCNSNSSVSNRLKKNDLQDLNNNNLPGCSNQTVSFNEGFTVEQMFNCLASGEMNQEQKILIKALQLATFQEDDIKVFKGMFWNREHNHKFLYLLVQKPNN